MSELQIRVFDGTRQLFSSQAQFLTTITDGNKTQQVRGYYADNDLTFDLPFFNNFGDNYTVVVWAEGYKQAGFTPVKLSSGFTRTLDVMLVAQGATCNFGDTTWNKVSTLYPFLGGDADAQVCEKRFDDLIENAPLSVACFLNLVEAMRQISLPQNTPLDYLKQMCWDPEHSPAQDRFFAWADPLLIEQVKVAAADGKFAVEKNPGLFHPGATSSWKQIEFGEANVQLTFHENDTLDIDGTACVMVEPDIDYYQDLGAHAILEVIANAVTHSLTDPRQVYVLRWMAGRMAGIPEFAPLYTMK